MWRFLLVEACRDITRQLQQCRSGRVFGSEPVLVICWEQVGIDGGKQESLHWEVGRDRPI